MLNLPNVTLYTVDCVSPRLALGALKISMSKITFGRVLLFSDTFPHEKCEGVEFFQIQKINSLMEYSAFILHDLNAYIDTDFCLSVHADGFIHNPSAWREEFLKYDYIGAPWPADSYFVKPDTRVGNGGVSLRSKRLLELQTRMQCVGHEDVVVTQVYRQLVLQNGCTYAPLHLAQYFSQECVCPDLNINVETDCFAFHGKAYTHFHIIKNQEILQKMNTRTIYDIYQEKRRIPSDINEHLDTLYDYASKCESVAEFGVRYVVSSYALAAAKPSKLICLDIERQPQVDEFELLCKQEGVNMEFVLASSLEYDMPQVDMLFIDTLHTRAQLAAELVKHHSNVKKYLLFHDTVFWGNKDEDTNLEGPDHGLVPALREFLRATPNWKEVCTYTNNNGLTILKNTNNV